MPVIFWRFWIPSRPASKRMRIQSTHFLSFPLPLGFLRTAGHPPHPNATDPDAQDDEADATPEAEVTAAPIEPYSVDDILMDGCFIAREKLEKILERLRTKKNLILQGPPGTGKTWLAKAIGFRFDGATR